MSSARHVVTLLVLAIGLSSCSSRQSVGRSGPPVTLTLQMTKSPLKPNQFAIVEMRLENNTPTPLWLNGRMVVNRFGDPPELREIWFLLNGPDGKSIPLECMKNVRPPDRNDYTTVKPNGTISRTEILNSCFQIDRPGKYVIVAFYQDGNPKAPPPPPGAVYASGPVESAPLEFEILPQ